MIRIPLHNRGGEVVAHALIDECDAALAAQPGWYLHSRYVVRKEWVPPDQWPAYWLHREVLGLDRDDPRRVDHINRDRLDCRRANLRIATHAENMQNVPARTGTSRHRGVYWDTECQMWRARAQIGGRRHYLGRYSDEEEAAAVASAFRAEHMPFSDDAAAA